MKTLKTIIAVMLLACFSWAQQKTLTQTSLSAAITSSATAVPIASTSGMSGTSGQTGWFLYVDREAMQILSIPNSGHTVVQRGAAGTKAEAHASGAMVLAGQANWFYSKDPGGGACTPNNVLVSPMVNIITGNQWLCNGVTSTAGVWVPGWGNPGNSGIPPGVMPAVASTAGSITPSGPLFHVTGTAAITGFNIPVGFHGGSICIIPDGAFSTTTAGNIAIATNATASKTLCYTYDGAATKPFFASY